MLTIILIALISHFLGDFLFQGNKIAKGRFPNGGYVRDNKRIVLKYNIYHSLTHIIILYILLIIFNFFTRLDLTINPLCMFLVGITHFAIDYFKSSIILKNSKLHNNVWIFIIDQLLHFGSIMTIFTYNNWTSIGDRLVLLVTYFPSNLSEHNKVLLIILIIFFSTYGTGYFAKFLLNSIGNTHKNPEIKGANNGGFIIGILERIFIILGIVIKQPAIIAFVLTLKSIARYNKFKEDEFVEYFIIGTFLSLIVGILSGMIISRIISIPVS